MSTKEIEDELNDIEQKLIISILTMEYLEIKKNQKLIIKKTIEKMMENQGSKDYHYEFRKEKKLKEFKKNIKIHFKYIISHCDKPYITHFEDYYQKTDLLNAYCDFYTQAISFIKIELQNDQLICNNLESYFNKIKTKLRCKAKEENV